ncbi:endoribonuclease YbeY [Fulvitalea axinellae]|uniref:Endoribonuclease YbeY n=1 Tax=Fulvitalea axinellae TaxID=1182444 RepID=A0AAU9D429_9BACT|nr:endoribonuclease YbeY [Fulvitalea axinellae]
MINIFTEDIEFELSEAGKTTEWIEGVIERHGFELAELNYIFCSDEYLHKINVEYLDHDTYTDIITFDNSEEEGVIESDVFVSVERIRENASKFGKTFENELRRVIIHGVLHLLGFKDKSPEEAENMRKKEDEALAAY